MAHESFKFLWLFGSPVRKKENEGHCLLKEIHYSGKFVVVYFQASERCHGMILSSYMLKPVQRIPSYRLLLIGEYKHLVCKS